MTWTRPTVGDPAPLFELPDVAGGTVALDPAAHAATVVVFTANGCPYARAWHDRLQDVVREYAPRDVAVLQVLSNDETDHPEDGLDGARARVAAGEVAGPLLRDAGQSVARAYGATATPQVFVVDRAGTLRYSGAPDGDHDDPGQRAGWLRAALEDLLAGRPVARPVTSPAGCSIKWRVELLWWSGCPSHDQAAELVRAALTDLGRGEVHLVEREVRTREEAVRLGFPGSPTVHVGGADLFPTGAAAALSCRLYVRPDGRTGPLPDPADLTARLREALARPWELPGWVDFRRPAPPS